MPEENFMMMVRSGDTFVRYPAPDFIKKSYNHLVRKVIASKYTPEILKDRVQEIYFELVNKGARLIGSGMSDVYEMFDANNVPDLQEIAEIINDENIEIISIFYRDYALAEEEIDNVLAKYNHEIGSSIDLWVEDILRLYNYPYSGSAYQSLFGGEVSSFYTIIQKGQNIIYDLFLLG